MIRVVGVLALLLLSAGCEVRQSVAGFVTEVDSSSITQIDGFKLRTPEGTEFDFRVGLTELDRGAFPPTHLREHMALAQPVVVAYRDEDAQLVAYRLQDAPWLQQ